MGANGKALNVVGQGDLTVFSDATEENWVTWKSVYHALDIKRNVLPTHPLESIGYYVQLGGSDPGIFDAAGKRLITTELSNGLTYMRGFVHADEQCFAVEVQQRLGTDGGASENERTVTSANYGICGSGTSAKKPSML